MKPIAATTKQPTLSTPNAEAAAPNNNDRPACCGLLIAIQAHTTNAKSANHPSIHQIINVNRPRTLRQRALATLICNNRSDVCRLARAASDF
jgi:hypothetical protein